MSCEIIVVQYGLPELEAECAASVEEHTDGEYTLTMHDNYEADESLSKVWNDCIRASDSEYICILNNDTRIEEDGWLTKLLESFETIENLGAVGPVTNSASGPQGSEKALKKWRRKEQKIAETKMLVGFCMVFPKSLWEEIGGFDERYALYGEDSDFCKELRVRGYKLAIRSDVFVFHHGKASTPIAEARGKDIPALIKESRVLYRKKWLSGIKNIPKPSSLSIQDKRIAAARTTKADPKLLEDKKQRRARFREWKADKAKKDD